MWGWLMVLGGLFVGVSPHIPLLATAGRAVAFLAGVLGVLAVALGLLAATTGGSFRLPVDQALLLVLIAVAGVTGITYSRSKPTPRDSN